MKQILRAIVVSLCCCAIASAQQTTGWANKKSSWLQLTAAQRTEVTQFAEDYKQFMTVAKTSLTSTREVLRLARAAGFGDYSDGTTIRPGARLIISNRDRALALVVVGNQPIVNGSRLIAAHQDSPHIDLKSRPVYAAGDYALFKTVYYGGLKKYQWSNLPMALVGRIDTEDGRTIDVNLGFRPGEPVFVIPDNAPHSDTELRNRTYTNVLTGEEMDPVVGNVPGTNDSVAAEVSRALQQQFGVKEEDFVSAELSLVPLAQPQDVGIDHSMVGAYGQDDKLSAYCAVRALLDIKGTPQVTAIAYLTNFEEVGSGNNTGAASQFLNSVYERLVAAQQAGGNSDLAFRRALHNAQVISADANDGVNPVFPTTSEASNAARLGFGTTIKRYGGSFDAPSEFTARIRALLDRNGIPWQTQTPKVDVGGGGTIGGFMSREDMEVIDMGVPLLSMHSPFEISSKVDIWNFYRFMKVFYAS